LKSQLERTSQADKKAELTTKIDAKIQEIEKAEQRIQEVETTLFKLQSRIPEFASAEGGGAKPLVTMLNEIYLLENGSTRSGTGAVEGEGGTSNN
ncbi:unnamed protein product, partial [Amoebophrya sp. A25]